MRLVCLGMLLALALSPSAATATTTYRETIRCPIGGEVFEVTSISSYTTFGQRPDGMPYGTLIFPVPLQECPGNRLLLYRDFTPDELKQLEPLIASQAYRDLVALETTYYRASWLERRLRPDGDDWIWLLLRATWQVDGSPSKKTRYQTEFAAAATAVTARPGDLEWLALQARAANALRELGRFEESMTLLRTLQREAVTAPSANDQEAQGRRGWGRYLEGLEKAVTERDPASEPWAMLSEDHRIRRCVDMSPAERGASIDGFCISPKVATRVQEIVTNRARACLEMAKDSPNVWSEDFCANPEIAERAKALPPEPTED